MGQNYFSYYGLWYAALIFLFGFTHDLVALSPAIDSVE